MKKIASLLMFCFISALFLAMTGCGGGGGSSQATKVTVNLGVPKAAQRTIRAKTKSAVSSVPLNIVSVKLVISGGDMTTIERVVSISGQTDIIETFDVPSGTKRNFQALASASDGSVLYQGSTTEDLDGSAKTIVIDVYGTVSACQSLFDQNRIPEARDICVSAAKSYGTTVSDDADNTRFLAAFSRIYALMFSVSSDGNPGNGLNTIGDLLGSFGCTVDPAAGPLCPKVLPAGAPTGAQLQTFIATVLKPELEGTVENLNGISQAFNKTWMEPFGSTQVQSDYGDVLALRAMAKFLLASVLIENSYNLDADLAKAFNLNQTEAEFIASNPLFLTLSTTSGLPVAQTLMGNTIDDTVSAIDWRQSHTSQGNNLIVLSDFLKMSPDKIDRNKQTMNEFKASLTGPSDIHGSTGNLNGTLNLNIFFLGVDLRSLMPTTSPGPFPDPTFRGIWTNYVPGASDDPNHKFTGSVTMAKAKTKGRKSR